MKFETLTYAALPPDVSGDSAAGPQEAPITSPKGGFSPAHMTDNIASFLLRLAAYFQGYLSSLPSMKRLARPKPIHLTVIDSAIEGGSEPLITVRMNRAFSRRMRWLIKRGRVQRSGKMRVASAEDKARCNLTPGQFIEYCIRVHGWSRVRSYGLGSGRRALRLLAISAAFLQGDGVSLNKPTLCAAPLSPD